MPEERRDLIPWLAGTTVLAIAVRWVVAFHYYRDVELKLTDNFFYHQQANLLADGKGFANPFEWLNGVDLPTAAHPPLYSLYLAAWSVFGADTPMWHRLASGLVSALTVIPVALLVNRLVGRRGAIIAAFLAALYPPLWMNDGLILSESLAIPLTAWALWQAQRFVDQPDRRRVIEFSLVLTAGALTRSEPLLLFVVMLTPLVLVQTQLAWRKRFELVGIAALVAVAILAPWVARNMALFDEPTFIAAGPGYVLELANCDATYSGTYLGYWNADCDNAPWPEGDESVIGAHKLDRALDYIGDHIDEQPKVVAARIGRLFGVFRPAQTADWDVFFERRIKSHVWVALIGHYVVTLLAIGGAVVLRRRKLTLIPTLATIGVAVWTAAISFGITRYRITADVALVVLAAVAVDAMLRHRIPKSATPT